MDSSDLRLAAPTFPRQEALGDKANPRKLANVYENSSVRRLGYLLELGRYGRQAKVLEPFPRSQIPETARSCGQALGRFPRFPAGEEPKWMLLINERIVSIRVAADRAIAIP